MNHAPTDKQKTQVNSVAGVYIIFSLSPWIAGRLIDARGSTAIAFEYGAALLVLALMAVLTCLSFQRRPKPQTSLQ